MDPDHILFLDGNTYAMDFTGFEEVLPNCVYAIHDYASFGFPAGDPYVGTPKQKEALRRSYERNVEFIKGRGVPISFFSLPFTLWGATSTDIYYPAGGRSGTASSVRFIRARKRLITKRSTNSGIISLRSS